MLASRAILEPGCHNIGCGDPVYSLRAECWVQVGGEAVPPRGFRAGAWFPAVTVKGDDLLGGLLEGRNPASPRILTGVELLTVPERRLPSRGQADPWTTSEPDRRWAPVDDDPL